VAAETGAMRHYVPIILLALASCGFQPSAQSGSSVTITLPPPRPAPAPGFSTAILDPR
jgi:hypothetical protein